MMRFATFCFALALFGSAIAPSLTAQQPQPQLVVQAANTAAIPAPAKVAVTSIDTTVPAAINALQDAKKANDEVLKKQEATLQQLDELQKATDQLRIFAKRG